MRGSSPLYSLTTTRTGPWRLSGRTRLDSGIALIIVMVVILVLGVLAGGFAYSMKVETRLARNHTFESELEWLGRSGVEKARYILAMQMLVPGENSHTSLNQKWAGASVTNEMLMGESLDNNLVGNGSFSLKIADTERKLNINYADKAVLQRAMDLAGADGMQARTLINAILDWRDTDDNCQSGSTDTENDYYLTLSPPYYCKNGPFDHISELLLLNGMAPEFYEGLGWTEGRNIKPSATRQSGRIIRGTDSIFLPGLKDLFCTVGARQININTTTEQVLQLIPGVDENLAHMLIERRRGPDGADGTEDDNIYRTIQQISQAGPAMDPQAMAALSNYLSVQSQVFEVDVDAAMGTLRRHFYALLRRTSGRNVDILYFH